MEYNYCGLAPAQILLPCEGIDLCRWAVIACDQFTSQPEYWQQVQTFVGEAPSTLNLIQPEAFLKQGDNHEAIQSTMKQYLSDGTLIPATEKGFILTERTTCSGKRLGLVAALDLECYDFVRGDLLCRATEDTVAERLPPRVKIREEAVLELPHVMLLIDDPDFSVIEPLVSSANEPDLLYDFDLMEQGGHLKGWRLEEPSRLLALSESLQRLCQKADGFLYAVGDGNHSLAAAKKCYEKSNRPELRFALVEIVNLHSSAMNFEPIHRVISNCNVSELIASAVDRMNLETAVGNNENAGAEITFVSIGDDEHYRYRSSKGILPIAAVQNFLDDYLPCHPECGVDYIHDEPDLRALAKNENSVGILLPAIDKHSLFPGIRSGGHLPRKAFSIGTAKEKRYYMECRKINE